MKAVPLRRHGGPEVLRVEELEAPLPGDGEVAVDVEAIGINYAEVLSRKGLYGWAPDLPYVPGMEACGRVAELGPGVEGRAVGERVIVGAQTGCYAERVVVPATQALPVLEDYSLEENAAFAVNYMTAWVSLMEMARLRTGDRVLVTAAAGGVGSAVVQLAKAYGCTVFGGVGSAAKLDTVRALGADAAISYSEAGFAERVREAAGVGDRGRCIDVALEVVGGEVFRDTMDLLAPFGRTVVVGFAGYELRWWNPLTWWRTWRDMPRAGIARLAVRSNGLLGSHIGYLLKNPERMERLWAELTTFAGEHGIRPLIGRTFVLDEIADAHRFMESRDSIGKLIVRTG